MSSVLRIGLGNFATGCSKCRYRRSKNSQIFFNINREYIKPARLLMYRAEFHERSELFIMTALYRLGTGASFRTCRALCNISTSEVRLFFDTFLHAMHEMREEFIFLLTNITELRRVSKYIRSPCKDWVKLDLSNNTVYEQRTTAGFTIFPSFVALIPKKTYVECTKYVHRNTPATASSHQPQITNKRTMAVFSGFCGF